jgi:hypothetical protein
MEPAIAGVQRRANLRLLMYAFLLVIVIGMTTCELKTGVVYNPIPDAGPARQHEAWTWKEVRKELPDALARRLVLMAISIVMMEFGYQLGWRDRDREDRGR